MLLDLFEGPGGATKALRRLGFKSLIWDTQHGPQFNLGAPGVEKSLRICLKSGRVKGVCFATPCTSFSLARNRTNDIRSQLSRGAILRRGILSVSMTESHCASGISS